MDMSLLGKYVKYDLVLKLLNAEIMVQTNVRYHFAATIIFSVKLWSWPMMIYYSKTTKHKNTLSFNICDTETINF